MERIPLANGKGYALVDDADVALVSGYHWRQLPSKHLRYALAWAGSTHGRRRGLLMHNLITGWPRVDHIDGNGLNNQRYNLRPTTQSQNGGNQRLQAGGASRYKGVHWHKRIGRWAASIGIDRHRHHLGYFDDEADAALAYDAAALAAWGTYARLNFPPSVET